MGERVFLKPEDVAGVWGGDFAPLAHDPRVRFTDSEIEIKLSRPVLTDSGETDRIYVHEPDVTDLKTTDGAQGEITKTAILLRVLAGIPQASVNKMRGRDFMLANKVITPFFSDSP